MTISKKENYKEWLGQNVTVAIDRPIGSSHPDFRDLMYPVNYGHIPGVVSDIDHEDIDAYILGQPQPLVSFEGKVIAVINRDNDEIKLVVTDGLEVAKEDIEKQVNFQEKYFKHSIITPGDLET
ncbi:MAG: inorganic pyrophosphatase [Patescibacteria group bacterium]